MVLMIFSMLLSIFRPGRKTAGLITGTLLTGALIGGIYISGRPIGTPPSSTETVELSFPAAAFLTDEGAHRQGLSGSTHQSSYVAIPGTGIADTYFYSVHDDGGGRYVGPDPGNSEAALVGYTGVAVELASGSRTDAQVAATWQAAIDGTGLYTSVTVSTNTVTVEGAFDAESIFTGGSYDDAGGGTIDDEVPAIGSVIGFTNYVPNASFAIDTMRCQKFRPADIPSSEFRVTAYRIKWGTTHTGQIQAALYQGGSGYDYTGATLLADLGVTTGSATSAPVDVFLESTNYVEVDPTAGDLWICWMGDGATSPIASFSSTGVPIGASSDFDHDTGAGNDAIWILSGTPPTGSGGTFPATLPANGTGFAFKSAFQLVIQEPPYYGDFDWKQRLGILQTSSFSGSSTMTGVFTSSAYTVPNVLGIEAYRTYVSYTTHDAADQFRLEWWEGGAAANDIDTATLLWDAGQTTGTATGWVPIAAPSGRALTPGSRMWISVKATSGGSSIDFSGAGIGFDDPNSPAAFYGNSGVSGADSESEYVSPDGGFSHDPSVASGDPFSPLGANINNSNSVGVYGIARVPGFAITANP